MTLTILENEKEEEKGTKGQAQRQKSQEDKPAFKKEEVNIMEKWSDHNAKRAALQGLSAPLILRILTSNLVFFKPQLVIHEVSLEHLKIS